MSNQLLKTRSGDRVVGEVIIGTRGAFVLLPPVVCGNSQKEKAQFGNRLVQAIVRLAESMNDCVGKSEEPEWSRAASNRLKREVEILERIEIIDGKLRELQTEKDALELELPGAGSLRTITV